MVKRTNNSANKKKDITTLFALTGIILLVNFIGSFYFKRFDLTSEKRYTLSESSKTLLKKVNQEILFKVYFEGDFNPGFTRLRNESREMLDQFRAYSNGNLQYEFINPDEKGLTAEEKNNIQSQLYNKGLLPRDVVERTSDKMSTTRIWPGAIVTNDKKWAVWQILNEQTGQNAEEAINNSVKELEYSLSNTIRKLIRPRDPEVTFIEGHNELDTIHKSEFVRALSEYYIVNRTFIRPGTELSALKGSDAIIIAKPDSAFSDKEKFAIDQFIMGGGKVLWLIDPVCINMDTLERKGFTIGLNRPLNIEDMLFKYGVRLNPVVVQDMQCTTVPINMGFKKGKPVWEKFSWVYSVLVQPDNEHVIVKNLDPIKFDYLSTLDTITAKGIKKTILLKTSRSTKIQPTPAKIFLGTARLPIKESQFREHYLPVACLLEGSFSSFVEHRRLPSVLQNNPNFKFIEKSKPTKMIVVADGDVASNDYLRNSNEIIPLGRDKYGKLTYANKTFLVNCVNYLLDDEGMLQLRSREVKLRLLDKKKIKQQRTKWQINNVIIPILLLAAFGCIQFWYRKRKYSAR
jgi:ABC-2 type transport system permease protein